MINCYNGIFNCATRTNKRVTGYSDILNRSTNTNKMINYWVQKTNKKPTPCYNDIFTPMEQHYKHANMFKPIKLVIKMCHQINYNLPDHIEAMKSWLYEVRHMVMEGRKEGNVLFNDALITFYLRLYGIRYMVKDHTDSERGNLLPPHR